MVSKFLEKKANPDIPEYKNNLVPIIAAAQNGYLEIVKLLIENGANVDSQTELGYTALELAASNGHLEVVDLLIQKGANLSLED